MSYQYEDLIRSKFEVHSASNGEFLCRCPFHDDRGRPNLYVNGEKGVYLCHACGAKGHVGKAEHRPMDIQRRLRKIQQAEEDRPFRVRPESWLKQYEGDDSYWTDERNLKTGTVKKFRLGYDVMSNAGTIPVRNRYGDLHGVIRRRLDKGAKPKYLDPKGIPKGRYLWGAWMVEHSVKKVALTEGPIDALSLWDAGIPALALMGARITPDQIVQLHLLGIEQVVIMTDRDGAGRRAMGQIKSDISGIQVRSGVYRYYWSGKDPDELTPSQRKKMFYSAKLLMG